MNYKRLKDEEARGGRAEDIIIIIPDGRLYGSAKEDRTHGPPGGIYICSQVKL